MNDFNYLTRTYQVLAQADQQFRRTPQDISRLKVRNATRDMVPIGSVATFKDDTSPYRQLRYNLYPAADALGGAAPGVASGSAMKRMEAVAKEVLPTGFAMEWTELTHQQQQGLPNIAIFALRLPCASGAIRELEAAVGDRPDRADVPIGFGH